VGVGFAIVVSLIFMFLLRCLVGVVVWLSIIGSILTFIALGILFLYNGGVDAFKNNLGFLGLPTLEGSEYYRTYGYICFGLAGLLIVLMICCCSRLRLAVAVCNVAGQFVIRVCQVTLVPVVGTIVLLGTWAVCLVCMVYLLAATNFTVFPGDYFTSVEDYGESSLIRLYYFIFATLWCSGIIQAIGMFVVASACCMWYYNHGANGTLDSPVTRSLWMAFRYHFGSFAFGSFILAFVQLLQMLLELLKKQVDNSGAA
jgi:choline transporter-like protein 2/4/5